MDLGRKGDQLLSMEEVLMRRDLERKGYGTYYDPAISVKHHVPKERLQTKWLCKRAYWQGVSDSIIRAGEEKLSFLIRTRIVLGTVLRIMVTPQDLACLFSAGKNSAELERKCSVLARFGHVVGMMRRRKKRYF